MNFIAVEICFKNLNETQHFPGFTGLRCENDERPCRPGVCFNGATCIVEGDKPRCECPIGFEGTTCMTEVRQLFKVTFLICFC